MLNINYRDSRPIYEQVRDGIRNLILSGILQPNDKLPSVRELALEHTINPNTIQRAYRELEHEGYIYSVTGRGSFVSAELSKDHKRIADLSLKLTNLIGELKVLGVTFEEIKQLVSDAFNKEV